MDFFEETREKRYALSTKLNYNRRQRQFRDWLLENYSTICWNASGKFSLQGVTSEMLCKYLGECSVHKGGIHDGALKSISTAEGHHAAIVNMYKDEEMALPKGFNEVVYS